MIRSILAIVALGLLSFASTVVSYKIEALNNSQSALAEGPHWDNSTLSLYFVDIDKVELKRYEYKTKKIYSALLLNEPFVTFIIPIEGQKNKFVVGCERRVEIVRWDGFSDTATVERTGYNVEQSPELVGNGFNDAKADIKGRLLAGTMFGNKSDLYSVRTGSLYSFEHAKPIQRLISNVGVSNGLTWNDKIKKFYYIDSDNQTVTEYNYNYTTGGISNPSVVWKHPTYIPDGMTIDADGNLYIAIFNGYRIYKVNPSTKQVLLEIVFPTRSVTSAAFGGPNLDILYVTTSSRNEPSGGLTYQVTGLGVKGVPMSKVRL